MTLMLNAVTSLKVIKKELILYKCLDLYILYSGKNAVLELRGNLKCSKKIYLVILIIDVHSRTYVQKLFYRIKNGHHREM